MSRKENMEFFYMFARNGDYKSAAVYLIHFVRDGVLLVRVNERRLNHKSRERIRKHLSALAKVYGFSVDWPHQKAGRPR